MSNYIFDIETGPRSRAELAECVPTFEAPSNWKDSEKIRAYVAEKEAEWFQSAALSALTGRVLAIGYLDAVTDELGYFASGDEAADLAAFWQLVAPTGYLNSDLIGFSSNRFDLPFLIKRSWKHRITPPYWLRQCRYWNDLVVDLREVWQLGDSRAHGSLGAISRHLGLGDKAGSGAEFSLLWNTDRQAAIDYCLRDVQLTQQVADILIPAY